MRRTEAERRRRAKNRARRAKQRVRVLVLEPYFGYSAIEQGRLLPTQAGTRGDEPEVRLRTGQLTSVLLEHEGRTWVRGWHGEVPDAFRAMVALMGTEFEILTGAKITKIIAQHA